MKKNSSEKNDKTLTIEQYRSGAGRTKEVKATLAALGLGRIGKKKVLPANSAVEGMVKRVSHLVRIV